MHVPIQNLTIPTAIINFLAPCTSHQCRSYRCKAMSFTVISFLLTNRTNNTICKSCRHGVWRYFCSKCCIITRKLFCDSLIVSQAKGWYHSWKNGFVAICILKYVGGHCAKKLSWSDIQKGSTPAAFEHIMTTLTVRNQSLDNLSLWPQWMFQMDRMRFVSLEHYCINIKFR